MLKHLGVEGQMAGSRSRTVDLQGFPVLARCRNPNHVVISPVPGTVAPAPTVFV